MMSDAMIHPAAKTLGTILDFSLSPSCQSLLFSSHSHCFILGHQVPLSSRHLPNAFSAAATRLCFLSYKCDPAIACFDSSSILHCIRDKIKELITWPQCTCLSKLNSSSDIP